MPCPQAKEGQDMDLIRLRQMHQLLAGLASDLQLQQPQATGLAPLAEHNGNGIHEDGHSHSNGNGNGNGNGNANGTLGGKHLVPIIIAGDFNTTPGSLPCKVGP